jgi:hypothetical protein
MTHSEVAEAKPAEADIETGAVRLAEADALGQSAGDNSSHQTDAAVPQALLAAPPHLGMKRGLTHRAAHRLSVGPYITHSSSSGVWLFAPNGNEGANN